MVALEGKPEEGLVALDDAIHAHALHNRLHGVKHLVTTAKSRDDRNAADGRTLTNGAAFHHASDKLLPSGLGLQCVLEDCACCLGKGLAAIAAVETLSAAPCRSVGLCRVSAMRANPAVVGGYGGVASVGLLRTFPVSCEDARSVRKAICSSCSIVLNSDRSSFAFMLIIPWYDCLCQPYYTMETEVSNTSGEHSLLFHLVSSTNFPLVNKQT